jgi:hypothetical protein
MSHKATHWLADIPPKELSNAEHRILFVLCDCHNPSQGCFPKQSYIIEKTGRASSSVNSALNGLEQKGFIRREQRKDPVTGKQEPPRYILGFEMKAPQKPTPETGDGISGSKPEHSGRPTPETGDGADSGFLADPTPVFGQNCLRDTGVVYKEEPVKEPVKEPCAADAPHADFDFSAFLVRFKSIYPRLGDPGKTEVALGAALEAGADPDHILAAARAYADEQSGQEARFISYSENWLAQERWKRHPAPGTAPGNPELITQQRAKAIRDGQRWVSACVSPTAARAMVASGLVTEAQCHAVGVQL